MVEGEKKTVTPKNKLTMYGGPVVLLGLIGAIIYSESRNDYEPNVEPTPSVPHISNKEEGYTILKSKATGFFHAEGNIDGAMYEIVDLRHCDIKSHSETFILYHGWEMSVQVEDESCISELLPHQLHNPKSLLQLDCL